MKILFLDFDGVLNNQDFFVRRHAVLMAMPVAERLRLSDQDLAPENLAELAFIAASVPEMKVVVSSTWRLGRSLGDLGRMLIQGGLHPSRVIGVTPRISEARRGVEIQKWLDGGIVAKEDLVSPVSIAILDDDSDMEHLMPRLVKTDSKHGLTRERAIKTIALLNDATPLCGCVEIGKRHCVGADRGMECPNPL